MFLFEFMWNKSKEMYQNAQKWKRLKGGKVLFAEFKFGEEKKMRHGLFRKILAIGILILIFGAIGLTSLSGNVSVVTAQVTIYVNPGESIQDAKIQRVMVTWFMSTMERIARMLS